MLEAIRPDMVCRDVGSIDIDALGRMGYVCAYALVTEENAASCAFHEKLGYEKMCVMPRTGYKMGRWLGVTWYVKFLREADDPGDAPKSWRDVR